MNPVPGPAPGPAPDAAARSADAGTIPRLYRCEVRHARTGPVRYRLRHRTYMWLVDLDHLPRLPLALRPLARFDPRDHFGGTAPTLRAGLERFLVAHGEDAPGGPVLMLTHARVLGHVFNPLTLYWCHRADGTTACVVAEVHNTYGERHAYLLHPDAHHRATTPKKFYVSPFNPVDGDYRMRLPEPGERLDVTVRLDRPDGKPFVATLRGSPGPGGPVGLLRAAARHPWAPLAASAAIRLHGIRLYLKGLPVQRRPRNHQQEGMQ